MIGYLSNFVYIWKDIFYFNQKYSDTLYVQEAKYAEPYACFRFPMDNTQISNTVGFPTGKYFALKILYVDACEFFCNVFELNSVLKARSFFTETEPRGLYCIDGETGVASVVTKYIFDLLSLENPNLPDSKKVQLRELDRQLTDESNPVVFIGKKCH